MPLLLPEFFSLSREIERREREKEEGVLLFLHRERKRVEEGDKKGRNSMHSNHNARAGGTGMKNEKERFFKGWAGPAGWGEGKKRGAHAHELGATEGKLRQRKPAGEGRGGGGHREERVHSPLGGQR